MIENLKESFLYERLPQGLLSLDERGLIQALCGGIQSRIEDLRSYSKKLALFYSVYGLPDPTNNVVSVVLKSPQGVVYKRSLDITDETPPATNNAGLRAWAAQQLGVRNSAMGTVQYDRDLLRLVDISTLEYLAATIGAVLHQSSLLVTSAEQQAANQQLVDTYFPRLRIKGTAKSFDVLGRALGFDDVRVTPLWTRMSPRVPQDVGNPANDADFAAEPEYFPRQDIGVQYDPLNVKDGPFYGWAGTCSNGTSSTNFYTSAINGFNPWVQIIVLGSLANGTATHVPPGAYALANGAPNLKAYVDPQPSSFRFEALVEGVALNGLVISVGTVASNGSERVISIFDRLSSIKYRSSYFDLGMTVDMDKAVELFGTQPVGENQDIYDAYVVHGGTSSDTYQPDGVAGLALSPYRPWQGGTLSTTEVITDFYTRIDVSAGTAVVVPRLQARGTNQELIIGNLIDAGVQAAQSMEEVRPATRFPRRSAAGLLIDDSLRLACYTSVGTLFTTAAPTYYTGSHPLTPLGGYSAEIELYYGSVIYVPVTSANPLNSANWEYRYNQSNYLNLQVAGTYDFNTGTYAFDLVNAPTGMAVLAVWTVTDSEVIRAEPTLADKAALQFQCQIRPEDDVNGIDDEPADEYPWLRQVVAGGEVVEVDTYLPEAAPMDIVSYQTAFQDQSGVDLNIFGLEAQNGVLRLAIQYRPYDSNYQPGIRAIAYKGSFKDLATLSASDISFIRPLQSAAPDYTAKTDYDVLFKPGYGLYHAGVVQGVLVGDAVKFYGSHHRTGLVGWLPLNEHPEDDLTVRDAARNVAGELVMTGVVPENRVWDADRGWHLDLSAGSVSLTASRNVGDDLALSFWIKPQTFTGTVMQYLPVFVELVAGTSLNFYVQASGTLALAGAAAVTPGAFNYVTLVKTAAHYRYGVGDLVTSVTEADFAGQLQAADVYAPSPLVLHGAAFHDLRIWNTTKTRTDLDLVRYHSPVPTQVLYPLGFIETANRGDRWGMRMLNSGWITPDELSPWYRTSRTALVRRYTSEGSYTGDSRFKEVGLGDGHDLPAQVQLGYVLPTVEAGGTVVMSGSDGNLPGVNALWYLDTQTLLPMANCNPIRDRIWLKGLPGDGAIYEVTLVGTNSTTYLHGAAIYRGSIAAGGPSYLGTEQRTGAEVVLAGNGFKAFYSLASGTVVQLADTGTQTPPQWLYLNQRTTDLFPGFSTWTRQGYTAHQQGVDITGNGSIVAVVGDVNSPLLVPAIGNDGQLIFENSSTLVPGRYRLTIETGNLGRTDEDFDGFNVELSLNSNVVQTTLLRGRSGFNVRGTDVVDVTITTPPVVGTWLLVLSWFNAARDDAKGTIRQLAVYGYRLERLATELFRVEINPADTFCNVLPITYGGNAPGGWLRRVDSFGVVMDSAHEGTIYPVNDTVSGQFPLADILTSMTNDKREDVVVSSISPLSFCLSGTVTADLAPLVLPSFGVLVDSPA